MSPSLKSEPIRHDELRPATLLSWCAALLLAMPALSACNENALRTFGGADPNGNENPGSDAGGVDDDDAADDDDGSPYDDGGDDDDAVGDDDAGDDDAGDDDADGDPWVPDPWIDECPEWAYDNTTFTAAGGGDEIYVKSWDRTEDYGTLEAPLDGLYAVYDSSVYESGASQTNESGFLRIRNDLSSDGTPLSINCGLEYIVQDNDNSGPPPGPLVYLGTFTLQAGPNDVTLHHFCPLYRSGYCDTFHIGDPNAESGCNDNGPNSLHLKGSGICLVPID